MSAAAGLQARERGAVAAQFGTASSFAVIDPKEMLQRFEDEFAAAGCTIVEFKNPDSVTTPADYKAFEWFPGVGQRTFINQIRSVATRPAAEQQVSRWHEGIHAIHANTVPATHFTPYNMGDLNIVLSPSSYILLTLLTERAAAAGVSMLGYLDGTPAIRKAVAKEASTVEDFEAAMGANANNMQVALNRVARESLMKNSNEYMLAWGNRPSNEALWLRNYYVWQALREYHESNRFKYGDLLYDSPRPTFVRLGPEDVAAIGNILGVNAFGSDAKPDTFFVQNPTLMIKHQDWLRGLNTMLGIPDDKELPTIREALEQYYGITPGEALEFSRNYRHGDPVIKPHGPESRKIVPFVFGTYSQPEP